MVAKSSGAQANTAPVAQRSSTFLNPRGIALKFGREVCSSSHLTGSQSVGARNQKRWALICGARKRLNPTWCTEVKWLKRGAWEQLVRTHEVKKSGWLNGNSLKFGDVAYFDRCSPIYVPAEKLKVFKDCMNRVLASRSLSDEMEGEIRVG